MITAKELKKITQNVIEKEEAEMKKRALDFCEEISKDLEKSALEKYCNFFVDIPINIRLNYITAILEDNGYSVKINNRRIEIKW